MSTTSPRRALLVVDVQNDFCEGGALAVSGGSQVAEGIADYLAMADYDLLVATKDWHIDPGEHWSDTPDFRTTWPVHCRAGSVGADFHPAVADVAERFEAVIHKGRFEAAYSGFEGTTSPDGDGQPLTAFLREHDITDVDIVGIATDHCVRMTALDAASEKFTTRVLLAMTAGVAPSTTQAALEEMRAAGVEVLGVPVVHG